MLDFVCYDTLNERKQSQNRLSIDKSSYHQPTVIMPKAKAFADMD